MRSPSRSPTSRAHRPLRPQPDRAGHALQLHRPGEPMTRPSSPTTSLLLSWVFMATTAGRSRPRPCPRRTAGSASRSTSRAARRPGRGPGSGEDDHGRGGEDGRGRDEHRDRGSERRHAREHLDCCSRDDHGGGTGRTATKAGTTARPARATRRSSGRSGTRAPPGRRTSPRTRCRTLFGRRALHPQGGERRAGRLAPGLLGDDLGQRQGGPRAERLQPARRRLLPGREPDPADDAEGEPEQQPGLLPDDQPLRPLRGLDPAAPRLDGAAVARRHRDAAPRGAVRGREGPGRPVGLGDRHLLARGDA